MQSQQFPEGMKVKNNTKKLNKNGLKIHLPISCKMYLRETIVVNKLLPEFKVHKFYANAT